MKRFKGWNVFEVLWLIVFSGIAIVLTLIAGDSLFGFSVFISGVLCVVLAAKGNIWTYAFGMYNSLAYAWLSYLNGLYGETMLNALFFVPMNVVGWLVWRKKLEDKTVLMRKLNWLQLVLSILICAASTYGLGYWLSTLRGQNTAYIDAFTNCASVIATLLMTLRFREQWFYYFAINIFSVVMWSMRLINGSTDAATMVVMWSAYWVNSIYGFIKWSKGARQADLREAGNQSREVGKAV